MLVVALLGVLLVRDNTTVINTRDDETVSLVENVTAAEAEDGAYAEFSFALDEVLGHDTNLAFYVSHQWIDIFIGDEQVYSLQPSGELSFIKTAGAKWVRLHIHREGSDLLSLSMLGIVMGFWQMTHNDFSPFIWEGKEIFLYYVSVTMMLVCMTPLVRSAGVQMKNGGKKILRIYLLAVAVMAIVILIKRAHWGLDPDAVFEL